MNIKSLLISAFLSTSLCIPVASQVKENITIDTLSIVSFNDFHGSFVNDIGIPGAGQLVQMILNERAKHPNTIVISGGDNFSGSYYSKITKGEPLPAIFKALNVEVAAVGNHEFDWGLPYLIDTVAQYMPLVAANITLNGSDCIEWLPPYRIVERTLKSGELIRIAFIGLTTTETAYKTSPVNLKGIQFTHPLGAAATQTLYNLKKEGVIDMIVLVAHIGTDMRHPSRIIEKDAEVLPFLDKVDAIFTAHSHEVVLDKINNVPVIQAGSNGRYIAKLLFQIRENNGVKDISFIEGVTIPTATVSNPEIDEQVNQYMRKYQLDKKLTIADDELIHDRNVNKWDYTPVGAVVSSSYVDCFNQKNKDRKLKDLPIIGVNHYGGIRTSIHKGDVTTLRAGNVLPFGGNVVAYHFDGQRLKRLLQEGRKNPNGCLQSSCIELKMKGDKIDKLYWCPPGGKRVEIKNSTSCIVVLDEFITDGGDAYSRDLFRGFEVKSFNNQQNKTTQAFIDYLSKLSRISSTTVNLPKVVN